MKNSYFFNSFICQYIFLLNRERRDKRYLGKNKYKIYAQNGLHVVYRNEQSSFLYIKRFVFSFYTLNILVVLKEL